MVPWWVKSGLFYVLSYMHEGGGVNKKIILSIKKTKKKKTARDEGAKE